MFHSVRSLLVQGDAFKCAHSFSINHPLIAEQINVCNQSLTQGAPRLVHDCVPGHDIKFSFVLAFR